MDKTIGEAKNAWEVHADTFGKATDDVRASAVAIVTAFNAESTHAGKCAARVAMENRWLATGRIAEGKYKNVLWARLVEVSFNNGLAIVPFIYPMPSEGAKTKANRKAKAKNLAAKKLEATIKAMRETAKAADAVHAKTLAGIRKQIGDRARNCVQEIILQRVLAAFDGRKRKAPEEMSDKLIKKPATKRKAPATK